MHRRPGSAGADISGGAHSLRHFGQQKRKEQQPETGSGTKNSKRRHVTKRVVPHFPAKETGGRMSFFSRKRHTAQPAPAPAPAPAAISASAPTPSPLSSNQQGSFGRVQQPQQQQPQRPRPPEQSDSPLRMPGALPPTQPQPAPVQHAPPPQQQQQQQAPPQQQQSSGRPRQDYPWSVRRLMLDAPQKLPNGNGAPSVTSMQGPLLPRYGHSVPLVGTPTGELFVFGGLVKDEVKDDLWVVSGFWNADATVNSNGRRSTKEMGVKAALMETTGDAPGPRVGHKSALVSSVLIVWGGDTLAKEGDRNDDGLYLLNLSTRDWTRVSVVGPAPLGRYGHAVGMCGNKFMMFGGQVDGEFLNDLWCFDLQSLVRGTSAWEQLLPVPGNEPPPRRTGHVLVTFENKIYIFGGTDGAFHYNDTWVFDLATRTWTELTCIGFIPVPREGHAAALVGDVMYVFGGRGVDGKDLGDLGSFKIGNQRWYMFQNMGPQPSGRSGHAMATADGRMFVLGGESGDAAGGAGGAQSKDDALMVHVLDTNLIKYPENKSGAPQKRPNGTAAAGAGTGTPPSGSPSEPRRLPGQNANPAAADPRAGLNATDSRMQQGSPAGDSRFQQPGSAPDSRIQPPDEHRRGPSVDETRRAGAQSVDESRRGAQSVDESRRDRDREEARRGAQSVDESGSSWRHATSGQSEDEGRSGDEARRSGRVRSPNGVGAVGQSLGAGGVGLGLGGAGSGGVPPPRPPRRSEDEGVLDRARSPPGPGQEQLERARSPQDAVRAVQPQEQLERARSPQDALERARSPQDQLERTRSPQDQLERTRSPQEQLERTRSPQDRTRSPAEALRAKSPVNMAAVAMRGQAGTPGSRSNSPADAVLGVRDINGAGAGPGHVRAGSAVSARGVVGSSNLVPGDELEGLKKREVWMRAALAKAALAGFLWTDQEEDVAANWTDEGLADVVVGLKQQQAQLQSTFAAQVQSASDRLLEAERIKTAALQETAFYRAKLAAYESGLEGDPAKLERERTANLERLLGAASGERASLERVLLERTEALALQTQLREQAEEQTAETLRRAEIAEEEKERAVAEHADLLDRNVFLESSMRDNAEKIIAIKSNAEQNEAEHSTTLRKLEEAVALRDEHLRVLQQTQEALAATSARADDLERQWERSRQVIQSLEGEVADMRADLEARTQESQTALRRLEDVENAWAKSREEADAHRRATTSGLGTLLDSHRELRADEDRATRGHAEKVHAMEMELSSLRKMLKEAGNRIGESQSDLATHQKKAGTAQNEAAALRSQLNGVRAQLATSVAEHGRLKQELAMKEAAVRERAGAASSAEVRLGMLRKYLVDNGIVIDEEDINSEGESGRGGVVRIQQLENELRERARLHQDTERELQEVHRRRDDAEAQVQHLAQQLERAKSASSPSSLDADGRAASAERKREETETRLNKRIQELDHDYQMAVKYVKGTEKMMRRMKEDYAKSKALNEKLQSELDASRGITSSEAGSRTRGATGRNTPQSDEGHDSLRGQLVDTQRSLQRLTNERNELRRQYDALQRELVQTQEDLVIAQTDASEREAQVEELEGRIRELEDARNGSDETDVERLTNENAALRREKDLLSHKVHLLLDDQGGYADNDRPISGISRRESQTSTENGMTQFDSFEDWQQRVNSRTSTNHRESDYEPSTSRGTRSNV
ncbi:Negative regulator of mitotic exit [Ceratobasidium sp. 395]|nr:Negative regulator of mitotic exit [Ceratobasidium sp. 395]